MLVRAVAEAGKASTSRGTTAETFPALWTGPSVARRSDEGIELLAGHGEAAIVPRPSSVSEISSRQDLAPALFIRSSIARSLSVIADAGVVMVDNADQQAAEPLQVIGANVDWRDIRQTGILAQDDERQGRQRRIRSILRVPRMKRMSVP